MVDLEPVAVGQGEGDPRGTRPTLVTAARAWVWTTSGLSRGTSQCSRVSRPTCQNSRADRLLLLRCQSAPPAAVGQRLVDVGVDELPADPGEDRGVVAMDDVDPLGAVVAQQRGPLVRALAAADHGDPGTAEVVEGDQPAGVAPAVGGHVGVPLGEVREVRDAGRGQDLLRGDRRPVTHRRLEEPVRPGQSLDEDLLDAEALLLGEPLGVVEKHPDRDRVVGLRVEPPLLEVRSEAVLPRGVQ